MRAPIPLSRQSLARLPAAIDRPAFDPANVRAGIVHLGLGGFHRSHMARYTHDLMSRRADSLQWGIVGVGLMPADERMHEALAPQDALYTLLERQDSDERATVIGSLAGVLYGGESSAAVLDAIDDPAICIVSLTITERGYCLDPATKQLHPEHELVKHDLADPARPRSAIGVIVEAYRRRMERGRPAFTALSCDNIQHNGVVLRDAVLALAKLRDPHLADWIEKNGRFPSTMVDRITPLTTLENVSYLAAHFGIEDRWPMFSEVFRQWVIEDDFAVGRPAWEEVGAQFVPNVAPYELMKLRLLNASHLAIAGLGRLAGYTYIDETIRDPALRAYMAALMERETGATLLPVPGIDLPAYRAQLLERFANSKIKDTVERVTNDAPLNYLLDPIRDRLGAAGTIELLALGLAAWMRQVRGEDESGQRIPVVHPLASLLRSRAIEGGTDPRPLLAISSLFGELANNQAFVAIVQRWLTLLYRAGAKATLLQARQVLHF
ncbi:MAG TPA: mannitol dehydrogenase family protein [Steroidobacter sp.]|nr:mannitol dehydrogenase family protein [Steroidobacter sp.]